MTKEPAGTGRHTVRVAVGGVDNLRAMAQNALDRALQAQYPMAVANIARLRRVHPDKTPTQLVSQLNRTYLATATVLGAASGASALTSRATVKVSANVAEMLMSMEASVLYALSVAEVHGVHVEDEERRRFLVTSVLLGGSATNTALEKVLGRSVPHWGKSVVNAIPMSAIRRANKILGPNFITKYGTKQGILVLGKQVPKGIGIGVGAVGNHLNAWFVIKATTQILGKPDSSWGVDPEVVAISMPSETQSDA